MLPPSSTTTIPSQPAPGGTPVANAAQADALLPFHVVLPSDTTPAYMNVYKLGVGRQLLQAYFDTPAHGPYSLTEKPSDWTVADLRQMAKRWTAGPAKIVVVDGVHVLVEANDLRASVGREIAVSWIRGDGTSPVLTVLDGPWITGHVFTEQQALSIAADIIGHGG